MKRIKYLISISMLMIISLTSCGSATTVYMGGNPPRGSDEPITSANDGLYDVHLYFNDDNNNIKIITVAAGEKVKNPFNGSFYKTFCDPGEWTIDNEGGMVYDFSKPVYRNFSLYLNWTLNKSDYAQWANQYGKYYQVCVETYYYNTFLFIPTDGEIARGTGVCWNIEKSNDKYVYTIVSCAHVCLDRSKYSNKEYRIYDCSNTKYTVSLIAREYDSTYDLSIFQFSSNSYLDKIKKPNIARKNYASGIYQYSSCFGHPDSTDKISFSTGYLYNYSNQNVISAVNENEVFTFKKLMLFNMHSEPGYSGGPAFDNQGNLIGIVFAGPSTYDQAVAFPIENVWRFVVSYL